MILEIGKLLIKLDLFARPVTLNYHGKERITSIPGFFSSLLLCLALLYFTVANAVATPSSYDTRATEAELNQNVDFSVVAFGFEGVLDDLGFQTFLPPGIGRFKVDGNRRLKKCGNLMCLGQRARMNDTLRITVEPCERNCTSENETR
jgi:hypothetical protein